MQCHGGIRLRACWASGAGCCEARPRIYILAITHGFESVHRKVFTVEMHHQRVDQACPGDYVGLNIEGQDKNNMPRSGDVMVCTVSSRNADVPVEKSAGESRRPENTQHGATTESEVAVSPHEAGPSRSGANGTTNAEVTAVVKTVGEARPPGFETYSATSDSDSDLAESPDEESSDEAKRSPYWGRRQGARDSWSWAKDGWSWAKDSWSWEW